MHRMSLMQQANIIRGQESHASSTHYKHKYDPSRSNSMAELKKLYVNTLGDTKGWAAFENLVKDQQPEAKKLHGDSVAWHLDASKVWKTILLHARFEKAVTEKGIRSYEELLYSANSK